MELDARPPRPTTMNVLRALAVTLLTVPLAVAGLVLGTAGPAAACSCVTADTAEFVRMAEVVFRGTLTGRDGPDEVGGWSSSTDPVVYTFEVAEVFEGEVAATAEVSSAVLGASCGLEGMEDGREYLVFAGHDDLFGKETDVLHANLCGGTGGAGDARVAEVEEITGPGRPPAGDPATPTSAGGAAPGTPVADPPPPAEAGLGMWIWGSGLLAAVVAATAVVGRRRA